MKILSPTKTLKEEIHEQNIQLKEQLIRRFYAPAI